jgi:hypothetical protein
MVAAVHVSQDVGARAVACYVQDIRLRFGERALGKQFAVFTGEQLEDILRKAIPREEFDYLLLTGVLSGYAAVPQKINELLKSVL